MFKFLIQKNSLEGKLVDNAGEHAVVLIQDIIHKFDDDELAKVGFVYYLHRCTIGLQILED